MTPRMDRMALKKRLSLQKVQKIQIWTLFSQM